MQISVRQIKESELSAFCIGVVSGAAFSGNVLSYVVENNGYLGPNVLYVSGGDQIIQAGTKTFLTNPIGTYTGTTGSFIIRQATLDLITGSLLSYSGNARTYVNTVSGVLQTQIANITVANVVFQSGDQLISGVKTLVNSPLVPTTPTNTTGAVNLLYLSGVSGVLSQATPTNVVLLNTDQIITGVKSFVSSPLVPVPTVPSGAASLLFVSGVSGVLSAQGGGGTPDPVLLTGDQLISGFKQFTGSPFVPAPTQPSGAVNLSYLSGVSGVLANSVAPGSITITGNEQVLGEKSFTGSPLVPNPIHLSGAANLNILSGTSGSLISTIVNTSGVLYDLITGSSGQGGGDTYTNNFYITGTGTIVNNFDITGTTTNNFNNYVTEEITQNVLVTGNFTNISFYFDEYSFITGRNLSEVFVSRNFFFTGYALGLINSGTAGTTSGSFYQRTLANDKTVFANFQITNGLLSYVSGGFLQPISGMNRVGIDILSKGSNSTGFCVGIFGGES